MPNVTIEVRTTCPTCGGSGFIRREGEDTEPCSPCRMTGTVVDAERALWLRTVAEWASHARWIDGTCQGCYQYVDYGGNHAPDCIHEMAKAVIA